MARSRLPARAAIAGALLFAASSGRAEPPALKVAEGAEMPETLPPPEAARVKPPPDLPPARIDTSIDKLRIGLWGSYFRGTKLLGYGTRALYQGGSATLALDGRWFPARHVGFEWALWYSFAHPSIEPGAGLEAAVNVAPLRWSGAWGGGLMFAAGGGLAFGKLSWTDQDIRAYPLVGLRFITRPSRDVSLRAAWTWQPISAQRGELRVHEHQAEVSFGWKFLAIGARGTFSGTAGGDPVRTYAELRYSAFVGAGFF